MRDVHYAQLVEALFHSEVGEGDSRVCFERSIIEKVARNVGLMGSIDIYEIVDHFRRFRTLPKNISSTAPTGFKWVVEIDDDDVFRFELRPLFSVTPALGVVANVIPAITPQLVDLIELSDKMKLLSNIRHNRILDKFFRTNCTHIVSHLQGFLAGVGYVEVDELYVGLTWDGEVFVSPVLVKGSNDHLTQRQIQNVFLLCQDRFPNLRIKTILAQLLEPDTIVLMEFAVENSALQTICEVHYRLIDQCELLKRPRNSHASSKNNSDS